LLGPAYQPWQSLIALGGGGFTGHGLGQGPQNRYDFLPYRSADYVFAVVGEETGWLGCAGVLTLHGLLVYGLLAIAHKTRERFGRLLCVGTAAWLGSQTLIHAAVCGWMVPATGLPMPLISYGGSSTLAVVLGIALCLNVGARREPVLAGDGYQ
jgi:rod shape determining protein RodA